jgi:UDP-glucose 4-epimerase
MTTWLLTGGAGYIGAHVLHALRDAGYDAVVLDDLSTGLERKVPAGVPLVRADVKDQAAVEAILREHHVDGVIHLAAKKAVGESVADPAQYYRENIGGLTSLLDAMAVTGVKNFVFSSSAATYGAPDLDLVTEDSPTHPTSPYGETKLAGEWLTRAMGVAHDLSWISLRYFNVAGAATPELGDVGAFNLVPLVLRAYTNGEPAKVFGDDYPTPDGTCVRDYIHVADLADAHVAAARRTESGQRADVYNVGTGEGLSVHEVIEALGRVNDLDIAVDVVARRAGDPPRIVAAADKIAADLGWKATRTVDDIAASAWEAWQAYPPAT